MTNDNEYHNEDDDYDEDDSSELRPCPECGADIYEDSELCPVCGNYITFGSSGPFSNRPVWWVFLGLAGIIALIAALIAWPG